MKIKVMAVMARCTRATMFMMVVICGLASTGLIGCGASASTVADGACAPAELEVRVKTGRPLNPTKEGDSLPTLIRVLQLTGTAQLQTLRFESLWTDAPPLGDEFIKQTPLQLYPNNDTVQRITLNAAAHYIAIVGGFQEQRERQWLAITRLAPHLSRLCAANPKADVLPLPVHVQGYRVTLPTDTVHQAGNTTHVNGKSLR